MLKSHPPASCRLQRHPWRTVEPRRSTAAKDLGLRGSHLSRGILGSFTERNHQDRNRHPLPLIGVKISLALFRKSLDSAFTGGRLRVAAGATEAWAQPVLTPMPLPLPPGHEPSPQEERVIAASGKGQYPNTLTPQYPSVRDRRGSRR